MSEQYKRWERGMARVLTLAKGYREAPIHRASGERETEERLYYVGYAYANRN